MRTNNSKEISRNMTEKAAKYIGRGMAWCGFWLMIGLANFGEVSVIK